MKKVLLVLTVLFTTVFFAHAQQEGMMPRFSVGGSIGVTTGPESSYYPAALGLNLKGEIPLGQSPVSFVASSGLSMFVSKDGYYAGYYNGDSYSTGSVAVFLPVQIGLRAYVGKIFFEGDAGASFNLNSPSENFTSKSTALLLTPAVGYAFRFGREQKFGVDVSVAYDTRLESSNNGYGSYNQIAVKAAFSIGFSK